MTAPENTPLAYTLKEAAQVCGVSVDTIKRAIRAGDLAARYPTSRPVIERTELQAWLEATPSQPKARTA